VRAVDLDAVVRERAREHAEVPVAKAQHAPHVVVVRQRLVGELVIRRIVAQVDGAEARAEAADAEVQLVDDAQVDVRHVGLEPWHP
jgi:hypothetical protein